MFWPVTGQTQVLKELAMDRFYEVREGEASARPWAVRSFKMRPPDEKICAPPGTVFKVKSRS